MSAVHGRLEPLWRRRCVLKSRTSVRAVGMSRRAGQAGVPPICIRRRGMDPPHRSCVAAPVSPVSSPTSLRPTASIRADHEGTP